MDKCYAVYAAEYTRSLIAIDSPTGFTKAASAWVLSRFQSLGYPARLTKKGAVEVDLGGTDPDDGLVLAAHVDTLGGMVAEIKKDGRLRITNIGGMLACNCIAENVTIYTREGNKIEGCLQPKNASSHVNHELEAANKNFDAVEVVLDAETKTDKETRALGIEVGDFVCFDPRTRFTENGYIKSRFLDDKLSVGILLSFARYLKESGKVPSRKVTLLITTYEEVGHGGACPVPAGTTEFISVDMGCVGEGLTCTERDCSICAKDSRGPYDYTVVGKLIDAAKQTGASYAVDVYPYYGSDADVALQAGNDVRHGLIGSGVYASHGYERSHMDGVANTLLVLEGYLFPETK